MCRSIKTLHHFEPPASEAEMRSAALQYVRKLSGYRKPSQANTTAFDAAVEEVFQATQRLLEALVGQGAPRDREAWEARKRVRFARQQRARGAG